MPTCDMGFDHEPAEPDPAPVVVEAEPATSENDVKIVEVQAAAQVETEKIWAEQRDQEKDLRIAELEGELRGARETIESLQPPEPPAPVIVDPPAPDPGAEPSAPPPVAEQPAEPKPKAKAKGFFGF